MSTKPQKENASKIPADPKGRVSGKENSNREPASQQTPRPGTNNNNKLL